METDLLSEPCAVTPRRKTLVSVGTRNIPELVRQLNEWQYVERTLHRVMAAWGRHHAELEDKAALHRHVWDQAEIIRRLRDRIEQFPGGKPDAHVHPGFQKMADIALFAPTFQDALDAVYHILLRALVRAYADHVQGASPIHDAPTIALLHEINTIKEQHYFWYRDYRRRIPHAMDIGYQTKLEQEISSLNGFCNAMPTFIGQGAPLCGLKTPFFLPKSSARPKDWRSKYDIMPYLSADFREDVEARRLFWAIGYLMEINLPDDQLKWLYYGDQMPWAWHHDVSRHLWDESRHGLSGHSRLREWGVSVSDVGLPSYDGCCRKIFHESTPVTERVSDPWLADELCDFLAPGSPMSAQDLYNEIFYIGMVAESGHFAVKNEAYADFREGRDFESAEMMLFDIIDETTHVQYAHRWLPELAKLAGFDHAGYRERAARIRADMQKSEIRFAENARSLLPRSPQFEPWVHYRNLLARIRQSIPFNPELKASLRSYKPM